MFKHSQFFGVCVVSLLQSVVDMAQGACFVEYQSGFLIFNVCQCILYYPISFSKGKAND